MTPLHNPSPTELSASAAATELGISRFRLSSLVFKGVLPARAVGRVYVIQRDDVERLRREHPELIAQRRPKSRNTAWRAR